MVPSRPVPGRSPCPAPSARSAVHAPRHGDRTAHSPSPRPASRVRPGHGMGPGPPAAIQPTPVGSRTASGSGSPRVASGPSRAASGRRSPLVSPRRGRAPPRGLYYFLFFSRESRRVAPRVHARVHLWGPRSRCRSSFRSTHELSSPLVSPVSERTRGRGSRRRDSARVYTARASLRTIALSGGAARCWKRVQRIEYGQRPLPKPRRLALAERDRISHQPPRLVDMRAKMDVQRQAPD